MFLQTLFTIFLVLTILLKLNFYFLGEQNISTSSNWFFCFCILCLAARFAAANRCLAAALCSASVAFTSSIDFCRLTDPLPSDDCLESDDWRVNDDLFEESVCFNQVKINQVINSNLTKSNLHLTDYKAKHIWILFAPAGFRPRGRNPRRHPNVPRVKKKYCIVVLLVCENFSIWWN